MTVAIAGGHAVLDALLRRGDAGRRILYLNSGQDPLERALDHLGRRGAG